MFLLCHMPLINVKSHLSTNLSLLTISCPDEAHQYKELGTKKGEEQQVILKSKLKMCIFSLKVSSHF